MKQSHICILFLSVALTCSPFVMAQTNARQEAMLIFQKYEGSEGISFKAIIEMYQSGKPENLIDKVNVEYVVRRDMYYCKIANIEILRNAQANYVIDHDDKIILVGKYHRMQRKNQQEESAYNLQSLFARMQIDSVQYAVVTKDTLRQLIVTGMSDPRVLRYQMVYDPATYLVRQLLIEMKPEDNVYGNGNIIVNIRYSQYDRTPRSVTFFSGKKFLQMEGKKATLQPAYKSYQLVNQL